MSAGVFSAQPNRSMTTLLDISIGSRIVRKSYSIVKAQVDAGLGALAGTLVLFILCELAKVSPIGIKII